MGLSLKVRMKVGLSLKVRVRVRLTLNSDGRVCHLQVRVKVGLVAYR